MRLLFPKEEEIMYILWELNKPCVISEILKSNLNQKRNTVAKVLIILEKKAYIKVDSHAKTATRYGRAYIPIISREEYENQKNLFELIEKSDNTQEGILFFVSSLIDSRDVNEEFVKKMEILIEEYTRKVGK